MTAAEAKVVAVVPVRRPVVVVGEPQVPVRQRQEHQPAQVAVQVGSPGVDVVGVGPLRVRSAVEAVLVAVGVSRVARSAKSTNSSKRQPSVGYRSLTVAAQNCGFVPVPR